MTSELVEIQPRELKFTFEVKKQSSCSVKLHNKSDQFVAFKVKTTSPKNYCVRPNIGIVKPNSTCDFTVSMQAQRVAPSPTDKDCKDKFLIQSTAVPFGTTEDDIISDMFTKDSGKYIEEKKLKVVLVIPSSSPVLLPINKESKQDVSYETSEQKERLPSGAENIPPAHRVSKDVVGFKTTQGSNESRIANDEEPRPITNDVQEQKPAQDVVFLNLTKEFEELTSKLKEAEVVTMKLKEQISKNEREKDTLNHELEILRKSNVRRVQVGFSLLYVCMVALICLIIGYLIHS